MEFIVEDYCINKMYNELIIECLKVDRCYYVDILMYYFCGQFFEGYFFNFGGRFFEVYVDYFVMEIQGFKNLGFLKIEIRLVILRFVICINRNQRGYYKILVFDKIEILLVIIRFWFFKKIN